MNMVHPFFLLLQIERRGKDDELKFEREGKEGNRHKKRRRKELINRRRRKEGTRNNELIEERKKTAGRTMEEQWILGKKLGLFKTLVYYR